MGMPDREKVIETCKKCINSGNPAMDYHFYYEVLALLKEQEQIVRCKDCKHWNEETAETDYDFGFRTGVCGLLSGIDTWGEYPESCFHRSEDFFCADGERRENNESNSIMEKK